MKTLIEILLVSTKLGLTSFGGPIAHLGYFHEEYVRRRKWLDEKSYADLVALCQFLPGPASSQVGIGVGVMRGGVIGGILAFIGFTAPSAVALILLALFLKGMEINDAGWIHGLKIVAVAVVAQAILGMAQKLTPNKPTKAIALAAIVTVLLWQTAYSQIAIILLSAVVGLLIFKNHENDLEAANAQFPISRSFAMICLAIFFGLLIVLPLLRGVVSSSGLALFDSFYRSGALVFGGGHVVLPLLEREFVPTGWLSKEEFLAGYGAAQAVPGPLFTFAAYIGAVINGWKGGVVATIAIFLPAFLLVFGTLPFWNSLRRSPRIKGALTGVNAAVVGILIAAFYTPIWTSSIHAPQDFAFAAVLFSMLAYWKLPPWIVVVAGIVVGSII
ncbi:chromate transporter [Neobacillus rhizophilus]|uniref:Chromate transporter n=1 Tax=Neobacillus rhizophilus TaxID=2833579 RepID=A0A942U5D9_9BACI|nr:chromate transporter [Neobacillus rhizophilus]MBS4213172.1 chromate transporter [Neobacillus rhizophilus]